MKYLLDTHTFLWWAFDSPELSATARALIAEPGNEIFVSSASGWEIATKYRLGRLPDAAVLLQDLAGWVEKARFLSLPIDLRHAQRAGTFTQPHRDPFDRLLIAQAREESLAVVTADRRFADYDVEVVDAAP